MKSSHVIFVLLLALVFMSFTTQLSYFVLDFSPLKNQFFGKSYEYNGFLLYSADKEGKISGGNDIGKYSDKNVEGVFSLHGAHYFVLKTVDSSPFTLLSFTAIDPNLVANNLFIEGRRQGKVIVVQHSAIGPSKKKQIILSPDFKDIDEIRIGSDDGIGIWNYFDDFSIGVEATSAIASTEN